MLHVFTLPHPWWRVTFLELVEPTRQTDEGQYFQKCLYLVDHTAEGGKQLWKRGSEYLVPNVRQTVGPEQ